MKRSASVIIGVRGGGCTPPPPYTFSNSNFWAKKSCNIRAKPHLIIGQAMEKIFRQLKIMNWPQPPKRNWSRTPMSVMKKDTNFMSRLELSVNDRLLMQWSHLDVKPSRKRHEMHFRKMEWVVAISWQLQGIRGNYGIYVAVTGSIRDAYSKVASIQYICGCHTHTP